MPITEDRITADVAVQLPLGSLAANTFQFRLNGPLLQTLTMAEVNSLVDVYLKAVYGQYKSILANTCVVTQYTTYDMTTEESFGPTALDIVGIGGASMAAPGLAALVKLTTNSPRHQGRKFFPGIATYFLDSQGNLGNDWTVGMVTLGNALITPATVGSLPDWSLVPGIWTPQQLGGLVFRNFTGFALPNIPAYQRRRKYGVGQ